MTSTDRRTLLAGATALAAAGASAQAAPTSSLPLADLDATATAHAIRSGQISALEAVDAAIQRAQAVQPRLNFLVTPDYDRARDRARAFRPGKGKGPFQGVPFLVKDLNDVKGLPTYSGSRLNLQTPAKTEQAAYIDAFQHAGLNVIGKSATPEYGFLPTTEPLAFGPTRNPWNPDHSTGGSSGGAAAAVAAQVVPMAHASDGGGSIRIPASCCSLFGLKPSRGRLLQADAPDPGIDLSVSHCVSRTVRDSAALFAATEQPGPFHRPVGFVRGPSKRRLRVGLLLNGMSSQAPDADVARRITAVAETLKGLGHTVRDTAWPFDGQVFAQSFMMLWCTGALELRKAAEAAVGAANLDKVLEPYSLSAAALADKAPPGSFEKAVAWLQAQSPVYAAWFEHFDVILSPVLAKAPPKLGWLAPTQDFALMQERLVDYVRYTPPLNVLGAPAMSVPAGFGDNGLPVGAHLFARVGDERTLFHLAYELEQAMPWIGLNPPVRA